jgi:hypothetical protein
LHGSSGSFGTLFFLPLTLVGVAVRVAVFLFWITAVILATLITVLVCAVTEFLELHRWWK